MCHWYSNSNNPIPPTLPFPFVIHIFVLYVCVSVLCFANKIVYFLDSTYALAILNLHYVASYIGNFV